MKKLLVSGCSWGDKNFYSQFHPEMDCDWPKWPQLLAEKLNMECINICKSGAGQEYIYSSLSDEILNHNREDIGFVMAAWSTAPRRCYKIKNRWTNDRQDQRGDLSYWTEKSIRYQYAFQNLMEQARLPYLQFQMISLYRGYLWEIKIKEENLTRNLKPQQVGVLHKSVQDQSLSVLRNTKYKFNNKFFNWPTDELLGGSSLEFSLLNESHKISEIDRHPNAKGHEKIAEHLYEQTQKER